MIGVDSPSRVLAASVILVVGLTIQSAALGLYLAAFDRAGARAIIDAWRSSLFAGFMGALASQLWFVAFALSEAAPVRTLALIEVPMAQVVSLKMFREPPSPREALGISLIVDRCRHPRVDGPMRGSRGRIVHGRAVYDFARWRAFSEG